MPEKLKSRKLWAFIGVTILVLVNSIAKLGMPTEDVFYLVIASASYILGQGYVDSKQEFPINDVTQSLTNIIQTELSKTSFGKDLPMDLVKTLIKQELGKLSVSLNLTEPTVAVEPKSARTGGGTTS